MGNLIKSAGLYLLSAICEISGGLLVWSSLRWRMPWHFGAAGGVMLLGYAIWPALMHWRVSWTNFGFGLFFISLSAGWAYLFCNAGDALSMISIALTYSLACMLLYIQ